MVEGDLNNASRVAEFEHPVLGGSCCEVKKMRLRLVEDLNP